MKNGTLLNFFLSFLSFSVKNLTEIETINIVNTNDKEIALEWKPIVPVEMARHLKYEIIYRKFLEKFK